MWNEGVVGAGEADGFAIGHVVHMGRSWFRMTPTAAREGVEDGAVEPQSWTDTMRIGLGRLTPPALDTSTSSLEEPSETTTEAEEPSRALPPGTVVVSWWSLVVFGASLLAIGAGGVGAVALFAPRTRAPAAPIASAPPPGPRAPVIVEPLAPAAPPPSVEPVPAALSLRIAREEPPARITPPPARRPRPAPEKQPAARAPIEPPALVESAAPAKWVDPFAD